MQIENKVQKQSQILFQFLASQNEDLIDKKLQLKNIFSSMLPRMPAQYIIKLVTDKHHKCIAAIKNNKILGGVCFRFFQNTIAEIAFLAVKSNEQCKGLGVLIINELKYYCRKNKIGCLMTYADNNALGFFKKQGFTCTSEQKINVWKNLIKQYEGGTVMQCKIFKGLHYQFLATLVRQQAKMMKQYVKKQCLVQGVYKMKQKIKIKSIEQANSFIKSLDGMYLVNWNETEQNKKSNLANLKVQCLHILKLLMRHPSSWPFRNQVKPQQCPDYSVVVRQPIDLKTLQRKVQLLQITERSQLYRSIMTMFDNCRQYHPSDSIYVTEANKLQSYITPHLTLFKRQLE